MPDSAHARYRERLEALQSDERLLAGVNATVATWGWDQRGRWTRTYGRFDPGNQPYALIVFSSADNPAALCRVEVFDEPSRDPQEQLIETGPAEWIRVSPFTTDPCLPTLDAVLAGSADVAVVRYRPFRRCTLRVSTEGHTVFAKVYPDARGQRIYDESRLLQEAAGRGELRFRVARSKRWDAVQMTLWQETLSGIPLPRRLVGAAAPRFARQIGEAIGSLAVSSVRPSEIFDAGAQQARTARYCARLTAIAPDISPKVTALLQQLSCLSERQAPMPLAPIHGAAHPKQWLFDGATLGLVDFDRLSWGEPELDLATFATAIEFEEGPERGEALIAHAVSGFEAVSRPVDLARLDAYRLHKHVAKAYRAAVDLHPHGDRKMMRILEEAERRFVGAT
jgi:Phosphotransferase enzyme family